MRYNFIVSIHFYLLVNFKFKSKINFIFNILFGHNKLIKNNKFSNLFSKQKRLHKIQ